MPRRLLDLGFDGYVANLRFSVATHRFPGLPWNEGGPGRSLSQRVNDTVLRNASQITDRRKSAHSFRHNLTILVERNKIPESIMCAINGHTQGDRVDKRNYAVDRTVLEMQRVVDTPPFLDLPLAPYVPSQFADT